MSKKEFPKAVYSDSMRFGAQPVTLSKSFVLTAKDENELTALLSDGCRLTLNEPVKTAKKAVAPQSEASKEKPKAKRKRRTKAQIAADKAKESE